MLLASACADSKKDTPGSGEPAQPSAAAGPTAPGTTPAPSAGAGSAGGPDTAPSAPAQPRSLASLPPSPKGHEGVLRWSHAIGGLATELARDVAVDAQGRVAVAGYFEGSVDFGHGAKSGSSVDAKKIDAFVSSYAADGTLLWTLQFGGDGE
ncbi:MAG TPA: hypothetical protein VNM90_00090, partial [Haliangium sp.]|nr:hypothetical protein [Haliangium sp.]